MNEIRHLKKNIREGIKEIELNKLNNIADYQSLMRWTAWVHKDITKLIKIQELTQKIKEMK